MNALTSNQFPSYVTSLISKYILSTLCSQTSHNPRISYKPIHKVMLLYIGIVFKIYVFRHGR